VRWTWWDWSLSLGPLLPSVLWHCWLGHLTRKNRSPKWPIMCLVGRQTPLTSLRGEAIPWRHSRDRGSDGCCYGNHYLVSCVWGTHWCHLANTTAMQPYVKLLWPLVMGLNSVYCIYFGAAYIAFTLGPRGHVFLAIAKWPKGCIALTRKQNTFWHPGAGRNPSCDFPYFSCVSAHHGPSLMFQISST